MKTFITTAHEEEYSDKSRVLGILLNFDENVARVDSFAYIFNKKKNMYIFFNTIMDMNDYLFYGEQKIKRAYMPEDEFDKIFDAPYIKGKFIEFLEWID